MIKLAFIAALCAAAATPAIAQSAPNPADGPKVAVPQEELVKVALDTEKGRIVLALDNGRAPITTANFLRYVESRRFDGQTFYRAMKMGDGGLIQGGVRSDARKLFEPIAHESTTATGLKNDKWAISMANAGPGTARSDFFILLSATPGFDADGYGSDGNGFAAFGHVIDGFEVVEAIFNSPTDPDKGAGVMKGQMLGPEIKIVKAERIDD